MPFVWDGVLVEEDRMGMHAGIGMHHIVCMDCAAAAGCGRLSVESGAMLLKACIATWVLGTGRHASLCPASQQGLIVSLQLVLATIDLGTGGGLVVDVAARVNRLAKGQWAGLASWSGEACGGRGGGKGRGSGDRLHVAGSQLHCRPSITAAARLNLKANHNCTWPTTTGRPGSWPAGCTLSCWRGHCPDKANQPTGHGSHIDSPPLRPDQGRHMLSHTSVPLTHSPPMLSSTPVLLTCRAEGREGWGGWGGAEGGRRVRRVRRGRGREEGAEGGRGAGLRPGGRRDGGWTAWPQPAPGRPKESMQGLMVASLLQQAAATCHTVPPNGHPELLAVASLHSPQPDGSFPSPTAHRLQGEPPVRPPRPSPPRWRRRCGCAARRSPSGAAGTQCPPPPEATR